MVELGWMHRYSQANSAMSGSQAHVLSKSFFQPSEWHIRDITRHVKEHLPSNFSWTIHHLYSSKFTHWPPLQHMDRVLQTCSQKLSEQFYVKGNWKICQFSFRKCFLWLFIAAEPTWSDQRSIKINSTVNFSAAAFPGCNPKHSPVEKPIQLQAFGSQDSHMHVYSTLDNVSHSQVTLKYYILSVTRFILKSLFWGKSQPAMKKYVIVNRICEKCTQIFRLGLELCG